LLCGPQATVPLANATVTLRTNATVANAKVSIRIRV
jgi:hypothetical protein